VSTIVTSPAASDDDVVTMEMEPEESGPLAGGRARIAFLVLAVIAGLALLGAVLAIVLAPKNAVLLLVLALIVLAIVVVAEIVLLLMARPRQA
jgi:hypothetical protein